jgi:hypothetical protein
MKKSLLILCAAAPLFFCISTSAQSNELSGFRIVDIHFDESITNKPLPKIPTAWRFVGVSNYKSNGSNLWFQDNAGNIYLISGFTDDYGEFVANGTIQKFNVGTNSIPQSPWKNLLRN